MLITANILCITLVIYKSKTTFRRRILAKRRRWRILSCCRTAGYPISAVCPEAGLSRLPLPAVLSLSAAGPDFWAGGFFAAAQRAAEKGGGFPWIPTKSIGKKGRKMAEHTGKIWKVQHFVHLSIKKLCNILCNWTLRKTFIFGKMGISKSACMGQILPAPDIQGTVPVLRGCPGIRRGCSLSVMGGKGISARAPGFRRVCRRSTHGGCWIL